MAYPGGERGDPGFEDENGSLPAGRVDPHRPAGEPGFDTGFEGTGELDLGEEDARLPWLEGDDEDADDQGGSNTLQLVLFMLAGVVLLAAIVGGIWWAQRDRPDQTLVADGATIEAPTTPYKTRPANPGGDVVAGTGDTSFAVAEGQTRQVRMGNEAAAPSPAPTAEASPSPSPSAAAASAASGDTSGVGVQVGAYSTRETAEKGWTRLSQQYEALAGMRYRIVEGRADIGTVYRLQAVPGDASAANQLCASLKSAGLSCQVKR